MAGDELTSKSLAQMAAEIFEAAEVPRYTRTQPGTIAGRAGEAFFSRKTCGNRGAVNFMVVLVRLDSKRIASLCRVTRDGLTAAQEAPVNDAIRKVRLVGVR